MSTIRRRYFGEFPRAERANYRTRYIVTPRELRVRVPARSSALQFAARAIEAERARANGSMAEGTYGDVSPGITYRTQRSS